MQKPRRDLVAALWEYSQTHPLSCNKCETCPTTIDCLKFLANRIKLNFLFTSSVSRTWTEAQDLKENYNIITDRRGALKIHINLKWSNVKGAVVEQQQPSFSTGVFEESDAISPAYYVVLPDNEKNK